MITAQFTGFINETVNFKSNAQLISFVTKVKKEYTSHPYFYNLEAIKRNSWSKARKLERERESFLKTNNITPPKSLKVTFINN